MPKIFVTARFIDELQPSVQGVRDDRVVSFHFHPIRPANLLVCLDPVSGEVNLSAGTYGSVSDDPLTIALHIHQQSHDGTRNVASRGSGTEVVVGLPGRSIVDQTWMTALPLPRGISEGEVGRFTLIPSRLVKPPSIAECPVNLECVVDAVYPFGQHQVVFCRVLGATVDEEILGGDRLDLVRQFPTHECDDVDNQWGGAIERLSVLGVVLPGPEFPCGPKAGALGHFDDWLGELAEAGYISSVGLVTLRGWAAEWQTVAESPEAPGRALLRRRLSRAIALAARRDLVGLRAFLAAGGEEAGL